MKCEFCDSKRTVILTADPLEKEKLKDFFPAAYLKTSKVVKVREFVDKFGNPTGESFIEIKGATKK